MADKLLIGVSAQGVTVAHWRGSKISDCREFPDAPDGQAAFIANESSDVQRDLVA